MRQVLPRQPGNRQERCSHSTSVLRQRSTKMADTDQLLQARPSRTARRLRLFNLSAALMLLDRCSIAEAAAGHKGAANPKASEDRQQTSESANTQVRWPLTLGRSRAGRGHKIVRHWEVVPCALAAWLRLSVGAVVDLVAIHSQVQMGRAATAADKQKQ